MLNYSVAELRFIMIYFNYIKFSAKLQIKVEISETFAYIFCFLSGLFCFYVIGKFSMLSER